MNKQSTDTLVIIRPHQFNPNPETEGDNNFQRKSSENKGQNLSTQAYEEVSNVINILKNNGIKVSVFEDKGDLNTPDSVFPNNWFSTHSPKHMALYPMYAMNRRMERKKWIIDSMIDKFKIEKVTDYTAFEESHLFLEGTGSLVLDRRHRIAYVAKSKRSSEQVLHKFCEDYNYQYILFEAYDNEKIPIYHTNVMMGIGTDYSLVCLESIHDKEQELTVRRSLEKTGHQIIPLTCDQINHFAGNVLELHNSYQRFLTISQTGYASLDRTQIKEIEKYAQIIIFDIPTIELAGGSIRCMFAEIFHS